MLKNWLKSTENRRQRLENEDDVDGNFYKININNTQKDSFYYVTVIVLINYFLSNLFFLFFIHCKNNIAITSEISSESGEIEINSHCSESTIYSSSRASSLSRAKR